MNELLKSIRARCGLALHFGHPLNGFVTESGSLITRQSQLQRRLAELGIAFATLTIREGFELHTTGLETARAAAIEQRTRRYGLETTTDTTRLLINTARMVLAPDHEPSIVVLVLDANHLFPKTTRSLLTEDHARARSFVAETATSLVTKRTGNTMLLEAEIGSLDEEIEKCAVWIDSPYPDAQENECTLKALLAHYDRAVLETDIEIASRLLEGTPSRVAEAIVRTSHYNKEPITVAALNAKKQDAIVKRSSGTLTVINATPMELVGRYLEPCRERLQAIINDLLKASPRTPNLVVLAGPPGIGKTALVQDIGCGTSITFLQIHSFKSRLVGDSEAKSRLIHDLRNEIAPNIGFIDEITEQLPDRNGDHDSGVNKALHADWLSALADPKYRGRSNIVGTTNNPGNLSGALMSRAEVIPIFSPSFDDLLLILESIAQAKEDYTPTCQEKVREAAVLFSSQHASPRDIDRALSLALSRHGHLTDEVLLEAAQDLLLPQSHLEAVLRCDYWALATASSKHLFPWTDPGEAPTHIQEVLTDSGAPDYQKLNRRLEELSHVRV